MGKRLLSFLCGLLLAVQCLLLPAAATTGGLFFLSVNDTLPTLTAQTTPMQYNGWIYVPANIFSSKVTGVNIGVYYGLTDNNTKLTLYNLSGKSITFDIANGTATAVGSQPPVPGKVVRQNGVYYVPAYAVCQYFGLTYSYLSTDYGPLLRIRNGDAVLSDRLFTSSAASLMRSRLNEYQREQQQTTKEETAVSTPSADSSPQSVPQPSTAGGKTATTTKPSASKPAVSVIPDGTTQEETPVAVEAPVFSLTVGLRASEEGNLTALLEVLSQRSVRAVVFFPADRVAEFSDSLRQTVGQGHRVGLIPVGDTPAERLDSVQAGEKVVARLVRQEVWFVLNAEETVTQAGYLSWSSGLSLSAGDSADALYSGIVEEGADRGAALRLLLSDTLPTTALSAALAKLSNDGDTFQIPRETLF